MAIDHARPGEVIDLRAPGTGLKDARTTAIVKSRHFETIRLIVHGRAEIPAHQVAGDVILHCLEGRVLVGVAGSGLDLPAGHWVHLDGGALYSVKGIEDSVLLLTIIFRS
jgi:quercetin dioxygenase-like cupin family protein